MTEPLDAAESRDPMLANDPIENADRADPTDPIESTEPTDPIDSIEPFEPMLRIDRSDRIDQSEVPECAMAHILSRCAGTRQVRSIG
jgi:hypothetical protein